MSRTAKSVLAGIAGVGVLAVAGIAGYFAWQGQLYVKTDNASVAGNVVNLYPAVSGTLLSWNAVMGRPVSAGSVLGTIQPDVAAADGATPRASAPAPAQVLAPMDGVIAQSTAVLGQQVIAGSTQLGVLIDTRNLWIVAYVDEGSLHRVQVGQRVDVHADALPDSSLGGSVAAIDLATQSTLSALPAINTGGAFTKVTQRVPVRINLDTGTPGGLPVGSSAEVTIHVG
jgi:multidrug resistance efflux pump